MAKNPGAALVQMRWDKTTPEERSEIARAMNEAKMTTMTPEERSEIAKRAAAKRWAKKKKAAKKGGK